MKRAQPRRTRSYFRLILWVLCVLRGGDLALGQIAMPDPKQMAGIPRPVTDLPAGSVSVRLIKGDLSNNLTNHPVELQVDGKARSTNTDDGGRAQFDGLPAGAKLRAVAVVDGERLESQEFPAPAQGGIRVMLVATDKDRERRKAEEASAPAIPGSVVLGQNSQIVLELEDESLGVFYFLEILNNARTPVTPGAPFSFSTPPRALGTAVMRGSSPLAKAEGHLVTVAGPFPPGATQVQVAMSIPVSASTMELQQAFPAPLEGLFVVAKKDGEMKLTSPQIERQQDTMSANTPVIAAVGGPVAAGQTISLTVSGLPHRSSVPSRVALGLAALVVVVGVWAGTRKSGPAQGDERKRLTTRREKLFQELVRLEQDHRRGKANPGRREELLSQLEVIYGALDTDTGLRAS